MVFAEKIRVRKVNEHMMNLAIISNPHTKEPRDLWRLLEAQIKKPLDEKLDKEGLEALKKKLSSNNKFIVK